MTQRLFKCRICGKLLKAPEFDYRVATDDPTCCQECNNEAEPQIGVDKEEIE